MNPLLTQLDHQIGSFRGCRVLELGGVGGLVSFNHLEEIGSLTVVESSQEIIAKISDSLTPEQVPFQIRKADVSELAFVGIESIDICISAFGVASSPDPERLYRQVSRVLRPSGTFVFALPHPLIGRRAFLDLPTDHSYFETMLVDTRVLHLAFDSPPRINVKVLTRALAELKKAGMILDHLEEIGVAPDPRERVMPDFFILRCKKA